MAKEEKVSTDFWSAASFESTSLSRSLQHLNECIENLNTCTQKLKDQQKLMEEFLIKTKKSENINVL